MALWLSHLFVKKKLLIKTKLEANPCSGSREEVKNGILHSDIHV